MIIVKKIKKRQFYNCLFFIINTMEIRNFVLRVKNVYPAVPCSGRKDDQYSFSDSFEKQNKSSENADKNSINVTKAVRLG